MTRVGGQSPDDYGLSLTVNVPTASATNRVESNQPLRWAAGPYNAVKAADGESFDLVAKHPVEDALTPLGCWLAPGKSRVHVFSYTGATAPVVGGAVVANGTGGVREPGAAATTTGRVLFVDTAKSIVEVLI